MAYAAPATFSCRRRPLTSTSAEGDGKARTTIVTIATIATMPRMTKDFPGLSRTTRAVRDAISITLLAAHRATRRGRVFCALRAFAGERYNKRGDRLNVRTDFRRTFTPSPLLKTEHFFFINILVHRKGANQQKYLRFAYPPFVLRKPGFLAPQKHPAFSMASRPAFHIVNRNNKNSPSELLKINRNASDSRPAFLRFQLGLIIEQAAGYGPKLESFLVINIPASTLKTDEPPWTCRKRITWFAIDAAHAFPDYVCAHALIKDALRVHRDLRFDIKIAVVGIEACHARDTPGTRQGLWDTCPLLTNLILWADHVRLRGTPALVADRLDDKILVRAAAIPKLCRAIQDHRRSMHINTIRIIAGRALQSCSIRFAGDVLAGQERWQENGDEYDRRDDHYYADNDNGVWACYLVTSLESINRDVYKIL